MSPTPWNDQKQVPNFAIGKQGPSLAEGNVISRRSSGDSDYEQTMPNGMSSSNSTHMSSENIRKGSRRLVPISHPAVDVPLCMECQVRYGDSCIYLIPFVFYILMKPSQYLYTKQLSASICAYACALISHVSLI